MMNMSLNLDRLKEMGKTATKSKDQFGESISRNKDKVYDAMGSIASMAGSIYSSRPSLGIMGQNEVTNSMVFEKEKTNGKYQIPTLKFSTNIIQNVGHQMLSNISSITEADAQNETNRTEMRRTTFTEPVLTKQLKDDAAVYQD